MPAEAAAGSIRVCVAHAQVDRQWLLTVNLPAGASVAEAIERCGIRGQVPGLEVSDQLVGVFGRPCTLATILADGDRVELYRPLLCDPKEIRRRRAAGPAQRRP
jgi:uncharacterized protein